MHAELPWLTTDIHFFFLKKIYIYIYIFCSFPCHQQINADHSPYEQGNASNAGSPARPVSLGRRPRSGSALSMKSRTSAGAGPETNASEREDDNSGSLAVPRDDGAQFVPAPDESASTEA